VFQRWPDDLWRLATVTGVLGGFTTFSAFSAESLGLLHRGQWALAMAHSAAHVLGGLACAGLGFWLARALLRL
jgi:fluoride exporter